MTKLTIISSFVFLIGIQSFVTRDAVAAQVWANCTPKEVTVWSGHVHVLCTLPAQGGIQFFAVPFLSATATGPQAERFLNLTSEALIHGRQLAMLFETTDLSAGAWGCGPTNCRRPLAYSLK
jgi:hypothetical protein